MNRDDLGYSMSYSAWSRKRRNDAEEQFEARMEQLHAEVQERLKKHKASEKEKSPDE